MVETRTASDARRLLAVPAAVALVAALALAGSRGGASVAGVPLYALCCGLALIVQWIAFAPAWVGRTERFYDLVGSLTYLTLTAAAVLVGPPADGRSLLLAALVCVWAARLGTFLVRRIRVEGSDRRFADVKTSFSGFLLAWTLQGVWVCFTMGAALAVMTSPTSKPLGHVGWLGLALWIGGFAIEVVADRQKRAFRARPENRGRFISSGLWAWSRHPNYFGEIVLWLGVAVIATPALSGWQLVTLVSPVFVTLLLTKGSGVPLLEEHADATWGGEPEYEAYKARTPVLVPSPPR